MSDGIKNPNSFELAQIMRNLPKHVWDSSAEPPKRHMTEWEREATEVFFKQDGHPLARKAVKVKRGKKGGK